MDTISDFSNKFFGTKKVKKKYSDKKFYINALRDLNYHFINLEVNLEMASESIVKFAKRV